MARRGSFTRGRTTGMSTAQTVTALREIGEHVVRAAKDSLKQGADLIVADAKSRCPVLTGKLRDSIKAESRQEGAVYEISANATDSKGVAYGQFVEFSPKINRPFLYPAMEAKRGTVYSMVKDAIYNAINRGH